MVTIWKYPLTMNDAASVLMPEGARVLSAGLDPQGVLCVWALVDSEKPERRRHFAIRGTGHPCDGIDGSRFISSVLDRVFMWHVFEVTP